MFWAQTGKAGGDISPMTFRPRGIPFWVWKKSPSLLMLNLEMFLSAQEQPSNYHWDWGDEWCSTEGDQRDNNRTFYLIRKPPTSEQKKVGGFQMCTPKGCRTVMDTGPKPLAGLTECYDLSHNCIWVALFLVSGPTIWSLSKVNSYLALCIIYILPSRQQKNVVHHYLLAVHRRLPAIVIQS